MRSRRRSARWILACLVLAAPAAAAPSRQHAAHVHGRGELNLILDGNELLATLTAPGVDLVGFEHTPRTDADSRAVQSAVATLGDATRMLGLSPAAACTQASADVQSLLITDGHDHAAEAEEEEEAEEHAAFRVTYRLTCANPGNLDHIAVGYFAAFERANELVVQAVGPWGQTSKTLTRAAPRLAF